MPTPFYDNGQKPFRAAIKALWREFRRCSYLYPPIYHEQWVPWDDFSAYDAAKVREAFRNAYRDRFKDAWDEWHGPADVSHFGRFSGSVEGLDEYLRLAESAYLVACEIDTELPEREGYEGWLTVLHRMADGYPMPLLRSVLTVWVRDGATEEELQQRGRSEDGSVEYPLFPFHWRLVHNLFTSSMAALEVMADEDRGLRVGDKLIGDGYPYMWLNPPSESTSDVVLDAEGEVEQPAVEAQNIFRLEGQMWHLRFVDGDDVEEGYFRDLAGFRHYAKLLANPGKVFACIEMQFFGKNQRERPPREDLEGMSVFGAGELEDMSGFQPDDPAPELALDYNGVASVLKKRKRLEENLEIAKRSGDQNKIQDAEKALRDLQPHARNLFDKWGKVRKLDSDKNEKARKRVSKALAECREVLLSCKPPLLKLARHLEDAAPPDLGTVTYRPSSPIKWAT